MKHANITQNNVLNLRVHFAYNEKVVCLARNFGEENK